MAVDKGYIYVRSESRLYTVGFYKPDGKWEPESDHETSESAARRVHYLNGGEPDYAADFDRGPHGAAVQRERENSAGVNDPDEGAE